jgi:threonine/homoserine/homoserine lactone efflux protein
VALVLVIVAVAGNTILATGRAVGLEILALCCLLFLVWLVINAWALVVVLADETSRQQTS